MAILILAAILSAVLIPLDPGAIAAPVPTPTPFVLVDPNVFAVAFAPNGRTLASADRYGARLWDVQSGRLRRVLHRGGAGAVVFSSDGKRAATLTSDLIRIWDAGSGALLHRLPQHTRFSDALAASEVDDLLAVEGHRAVGSGSHIAVWSFRSGRLVRDFPTPGGVLDMEFIPGTTRLVGTSGSGGPDPGVRVWNAKTGRLEEYFAVDWWHTLSVSSRQVVALTKGTGIGDFFALIELRYGDDVNRGSKLDISGSVRSLAFSPNGGRLGLGYYSGMVELWDLTKDRVSWRVSTGKVPVTIDFSRDGRYVAVGGADLRLLSARTGRLVRVFR